MAEQSRNLRKSGHVVRPDELWTDSIFRGSVTLDPTEVEDVWENLSRDTRFDEFLSLPIVLQQALVDTAAKRSTPRG